MSFMYTVTDIEILNKKEAFLHWMRGFQVVKENGIS